MSTGKRTDYDEIITGGIEQIKAGMRSEPDLLLWEKVVSSIANQEYQNDISRVRNKIDLKTPVFKLVWSISAAVAAVLAGVLVGNLYYSETSVDEKEAYKQEIYAESADLSAANEKLIMYYNEE